MADFKIDVIIDPTVAGKGVDNINKNLTNLEKRGISTGRVLTRALQFVGVAATIRSLLKLSDTLTNVQNRLKLVTTSTAQLNAVQARLFDIASKTRVGFASVAESYARTSLAVRDLGLSQNEVLGFTESLNKAIILSGASALEAQAGLTQLSQGLASGTLRGDELRSVLEQLPAVADVIAEQFGVTRGELRLLGEQGKISAESIIEGFKKASDQLDADFAQTVPTIGQAFSVLQTEVLRFANNTGAAEQVSQNFSKTILALANNFDLVARAAIAAGIAISTVFVKQGINAAIVGVRALSVAIAANPLGAIALAATAAISALIAFSDQIMLTADGLATLDDLVAVSFEAIGPAIDTAIDLLSDLANTIRSTLAPILGLISPITGAIAALFEDIEAGFGGVLQLTARIIDTIVGFWIGAFGAISVAFRTLPDVLASIFTQAVNSSSDIIEGFINDIIISVNELSNLVGLDPLDLVDFGQLDTTFETGFSELGAKTKDAFLLGFDTSTAEDAIVGLLDRAEERAANRPAAAAGPAVDLGTRPARVERDPQALTSFLELLQKEAALLQLGNRERDIQTKLLDAEEKLRSSNVTLTDSQLDRLEAQLRINQALEEQAALLDEITGPQAELAQRQTTLNQLYSNGAISLQEFNNQLVDLAITQAELAIQAGEGSFFDGFLTGIASSLEALRNWRAETGQIFASFFDSVREGFASAIADAILFGDSLKESIGNVARQAVQQLLTSFIDLGIQFVINKGLEESLVGAQLAGIAAVETATISSNAATTASSIAASSATTASIAADNATIAATAAPAAALESTATFGGAAIAGLAALAAILAFASGAFADGGFVSGPGGPRSDSIPARLSNGEFVVNARSTQRFRPQLEAMNSGQGFQDGGLVSQQAQTANVPDSGQGGKGAQNITIVNVVDASMVDDFLATEEGNQTILNVIESNSSSINSILGNT